MVRRLTGAVALACLFAVFSAPVAEGDPARTAPMQFVLRQDATPCADTCRRWVSATGMIRPDTVRDFEAFAGKHDLRGLTLALNSEGGSVHGAIALGRAIRRLDMTTTVGRTIENSGKTGATATLLPRADCESMCAFVLLSGSKRIVPDEARVRVHQIWLGDRRDDAAAATYSAEDLVLVQRDIGRIAQYTIEMGGTVELLEVSLRIPPWEPMRSLTREEMRRMRLDTGDVADPRPEPPLVTNAAPATTGSLRRMSTGGARAGWAMSERAGRVALIRRHPLTVEGEDFGSFDLTFSCGDKPNEYRVSYSESRRSGDDKAAPQPLKDVHLRLGYKTVVLALTPVPPNGEPGERASSASGVVPAAMISGFASSASRSLMIETTTPDGASTSIRIGNTGAAQHFPQLATSCAQARIEHAGLQPKK